MENKVKDGNFIVVQSFMVRDMCLKGNELLIYAIIYGFSQDGDTRFDGTLQYIADWTNSTKQGVLKNIKSLINKGYIGKTENYKNGVKIVEYYVTKFNGIKQSLMGYETEFNGGIKQSLPNNIIDNIDDILYKESKEKVTHRLTVPVKEIFDAYNEICVSLPHAETITQMRRKAIHARYIEVKDVEKFKAVFRKAQESAFLTGRNDRGWRADLDWILKPANFAKIAEGNYDNRGTKAAVSSESFDADEFVAKAFERGVR